MNVRDIKWINRIIKRKRWSYIPVLKNRHDKWLHQDHGFYYRYHPWVTYEQFTCLSTYLFVCLLVNLPTYLPTGDEFHIVRIRSPCLHLVNTKRRQSSYPNFSLLGTVYVNGRLVSFKDWQCISTLYSTTVSHILIYYCLVLKAQKEPCTIT